MRRIDPQRLLVGAEAGVEHDVQREEPGRPDAEAPADQDQDPDEEHVPDELVQEGRLEGRVQLVAGRTVRRVDLEGPGQVARLAEELLVEVVPPPADPLREQQAGRDRVHEQENALTRALDHVRARERAAQDPAPHTEAALPHGEGAPPRVRHLVPARDDVVEAGADDPGGDSPDGHAQDEIPVAAHARPADAGQHDARDDREQQHDPVHVDRERPDMDDARVGRWNRGDQGRQGAPMLDGRCPDLARPAARSGTPGPLRPGSGRGAGLHRACASPRRPLTDAPGIGERPPRRPDDQLRPGAGDLMASTI